MSNLFTAVLKLFNSVTVHFNHFFNLHELGNYLRNDMGILPYNYTQHSEDTTPVS